MAKFNLKDQLAGVAAFVLQAAQEQRRDQYPAPPADRPRQRPPDRSAIRAHVPPRGHRPALQRPHGRLPPHHRSPSDGLPASTRAEEGAACDACASSARSYSSCFLNSSFFELQFITYKHGSESTR